MQCKCGLADVSATDHIDLRDGVVTLHGQYLCDRWRRDERPLGAALKPAMFGVLALAALSLSACATDQAGVRVEQVPEG